MLYIYTTMITQTEVGKITPYKLDNSVLEDISSIQAFDGDINTLDSELVDQLLIKYTEDK